MFIILDLRGDFLNSFKIPILLTALNLGYNLIENGDLIFPNDDAVELRLLNLLVPLVLFDLIWFEP